MQSIETPRFGLIRYEEAEVIQFPAGLPGFEEEHKFLLIEPKESNPLKFLQSLGNPALSFICTPISLIVPGYVALLARGDRELLSLPAKQSPPAELDAIALDWLAVLCFEAPEAPTANLLGPIVIRRDKGLGVQSIRDDSRYSARHPLFQEESTDTGTGRASC